LSHRRVGSAVDHVVEILLLVKESAVANQEIETPMILESKKYPDSFGVAILDHILVKPDVVFLAETANVFIKHALGLLHFISIVFLTWRGKLFGKVAVSCCGHQFVPSRHLVALPNYFLCGTALHFKRSNIYNFQI
jgi:hypothetical protein